MRSLSLDLCCYLELRPAKFLYLKLMRIFVVAKGTGRAQVDTGVAKIRVVGQFEFQVKGAERVQISLAFCDLVVSRVLYRPCQPACGITQAFDIAEFSRRDFPDVTLYRNL